MIFQHTMDAVLSRAKTQTRRPIYLGDRLATVDGVRAVWQDNGKPRWVIGKSYTIHRRRGVKAEPGVRLRVTSLRREPSALLISEADAIAEGFESADEFRATWRSIRRSAKPEEPVWAIGFELIESAVTA